MTLAEAIELLEKFIKAEAAFGAAPAAAERMVSCCANFPSCCKGTHNIYSVPASKCACHLAREAYRPFVERAKEETTRELRTHNWRFDNE